MRFVHPKHILITGGSSGIGEALALEYATPGVHLFLTGRNIERLKSVAQRCESKGAEVTTKVIDVADRFAMTNWLLDLDTETPLDLVIANAGIYMGTSNENDGEEKIRDIFAVNLAGVLNTIHPIIDRMKERRGGQVALVASIAAFRGLPGSPAYSASKAAVKSYGEGLRPRLARHNIGVSVILPGFVRSRITDQNRFAMPFFMEADKAAKVIRKGLTRNKARIAFPWPMHFAMWFLATLPASWADRILSKSPEKE